VLEKSKNELNGNEITLQNKSMRALLYKSFIHQKPVAHKKTHKKQT